MTFVVLDAYLARQTHASVALYMKYDMMYYTSKTKGFCKNKNVIYLFLQFFKVHMGITSVTKWIELQLLKKFDLHCVVYVNLNEFPMKNPTDISIKYSCYQHP